MALKLVCCCFLRRFNSLSYQFVELEKIMVKIKMTRKLKKLELKQEKFSAPNERLAVVFHESQDRLSTTRQVLTLVK